LIGKTGAASGKNLELFHTRLRRHTGRGAGIQRHARPERSRRGWFSNQVGWDMLLDSKRPICVKTLHVRPSRF